MDHKTRGSEDEGTPFRVYLLVFEEVREGIKRWYESSESSVALCHCFPDYFLYMFPFSSVVVQDCRGCSQLPVIIAVSVGSESCAEDVDCPAFLIEVDESGSSLWVVLVTLLWDASDSSFPGGGAWR